MKRLVVLFDGTWNKPGQRGRDHQCRQAAARHPRSGCAGVAPARALCRRHRHRGPRAAAHLRGRRHRLRRRRPHPARLYASCARTTRRATRSIVIGFSRGAFQARSLAGLIALAGIARSADAGDGRRRLGLLRAEQARARSRAARRRCARPPATPCASSAWPSGTRSATSAFPSSGKASSRSCWAFTTPGCRPWSTSACTPLPSTSRAGRSRPRSGPSTRAPRCPRARSSSRSGSRARMPTSAAASRTARCPTSRSLGWRSA